MSIDIIGLIPAAGKATRISPSPCSKELFPIGLSPMEDGSGLRPKAVCSYLLESMRNAGVKKAFIVIRNGKWDIPAYYGDGAMLDMNIGYLLMNAPFGPPFTIDQAFPFVQNSLVAMGFPDILVEPQDAFSRLITHQQETQADVVLGNFPVAFPHKWDMVEIDANGKVLSLEIKPKQSQLKYGWAITLWSPVFTRFMHEYLQSLLPEYSKAAAQGQAKEIIFSEVMQAAVKNGLNVQSVLFENGTCLDVGTPDDLMKAIRTAVQ